MRVVVVGTGFGARIVAPAFDATDGCEVVEVVSPRDDDAIATAIARSDVDLVSVHSPPFLHAAHVRAVLGSGKAVLVRQAVRARRRRSGRAGEGRGRRRRDRARATSSSGSIRCGGCSASWCAPTRSATIEHVLWTHLSAGSRVPLRRYGWLFDRARGGGWIGAWGSHAIDTIRWCFGEVTSVEARSRIDVAERPDDHGELHDCTAEDGLSASPRARLGRDGQHRQQLLGERAGPAPPHGARRRRRVRDPRRRARHAAARRRDAGRAHARRDTERIRVEQGRSASRADAPLRRGRSRRRDERRGTAGSADLRRRPRVRSSCSISSAPRRCSRGNADLRECEIEHA